MAFLRVRWHCATLIGIACLAGSVMAAPTTRPADKQPKKPTPELPQHVTPQPAAELQPLDGFKVDILLKASGEANGSWISMAKDPQGRILLAGQRGQPITRVTVKDGAVVKQELLKLPLSECMGMLYAFDYLYVDGFGKDKSGKDVFGLFRCQ